jgi:hypothetical protein
MDLKVGDEVTVVVFRTIGLFVDRRAEEKIVHTKVTGIVHRGGSRAILCTVEVPDGRYLHNEGISWCRGHSGPDVDALKVALALG